MSIENMLSELNEIYEEEKKLKVKFEEDCKNIWNNLCKDKQLKLFCFIVKNLYESELIENKSYRGILYDKFNFDLNSYGAALDSGFLELHNSTYTKEELYNIFKKYFEEKNINFDEQDVKKFILNN